MESSHLRRRCYFQRFDPGMVTVSKGAQELLRAANLSVETLLERHCAGDWGMVDNRQYSQNEHALRHGKGYVESTHVLPSNNQCVIVTTSLNESETTVVDPEKFF